MAPGLVRRGSPVAGAQENQPVRLLREEPEADIGRQVADVSGVEQASGGWPEHDKQCHHQVVNGIQDSDLTFFRFQKMLYCYMVH